MTTPSRQFLVTQAVLNVAAERFWCMSPAKALRVMNYEQYGSMFHHTRFFEQVGKEFSLLADKYQERNGA